MSNPGGPIILTLESYVEQNLTLILKASSEDAFNTAFDNFYSKELKDITFNGKKISRDQYKKQILAASNANNTVSFGGIVTVLSANNSSDVVSLLVTRN